MAIRHMDLDACTSVNGQIVSTKETINDSVTQIYSQVDGMVGSTWIAPGADQFKSDVEQWRSQMIQALDQLQQLSERFRTEIANWEAEGQSY
jgi:uncharacterized protein YukE